MFITKADDIFNKTKDSCFDELVELANGFKPLTVEQASKDWPELYKQWEKSVDEGKPDYSVYEADSYLYESFLCWKLYASRYVKLLRKYLAKDDCKLKVDEIKTIADLGCGCGYSTVALKSVFPDATVIGTNLPGTMQYYIDKKVCEGIDGCYMQDENDDFKESMDMIFASEFFEHLTNPIDLLEELIKKYSPKYFVVANTFTKMSLGHFREYYYDGTAYTGPDMSRKFNDILRSHGYVAVETGFFNNRPRVWMYNEPKYKSLF